MLTEGKLTSSVFAVVATSKLLSSCGLAGAAGAGAPAATFVGMLVWRAVVYAVMVTHQILRRTLYVLMLIVSNRSDFV